jgi:type I restriction-modification system DNA methylase subunit
MNNLAQYYTHDDISRLLLSKILVKNPRKILELGVGDGSLFRAARKKWKNSDIIAGDIDHNNINSLKEEFPTTKLYVINGLSSNLSSVLKIEVGSIDVGICNPPYMAIKKCAEFAEILENSKLGEISDYSHITSDLIFLAQNLLMLKDGGELGIIVPDGLLTCNHFRNFRKKIIENYKLKGVIELPAKIFKKTEAKTHILIIKKCESSYQKVPLYISNQQGDIINKISINKKDLTFRMDYKYHFWKTTNFLNGISLNDLGVEIYRGSKSKKELELLRSQFIHTTDLRGDFASSIFENNLKCEKLRYAEKGDILISRVGKRCLGKILYVTDGTILISDCIYRLRIPIKHREKVILALNSEYGRNWIKAHSHGVCAKVISKSDLLNFRLPF